MPFITIGTFLFGLVGKKVTDTTARLVGIVALIVAAVLAIVLFFAIHDHNVRKGALDKQDAEINSAVIDADRYAGNRAAARDQDFANSQAGVGNAIGNAVATKPAEAKKPVGPASQAYYDELRRQKGSRR